MIDADLNKPLRYFGDGQFDVVVLSQTLQSIENTVGVLREVLRVGRRAVVSLPNFAYGPLRTMLFEQGRSPKTDTAYAYEWYDSPNRRYASILDFRDLCDRLGLNVEQAVYLDTGRGKRVDAKERPEPQRGPGGDGAIGELRSLRVVARVDVGFESAVLVRRLQVDRVFPRRR